MVAAMIDEALFEGLSTYQDVVVEGAVVREGRRACVDRWRLIEPWLPNRGALLDVGSNFGWFGLAACRARAELIVASVEADERSAAVQRAVLAAHEHRRVALLTRRAGPRMASRFVRSGQEFAAVFCLSVLHWIPRHQQFLRLLEPQTGRFFVEQPDPREAGAGDARLRDELGALGAYLQATFPSRRVTKLGETASHRDPNLVRPLWMVHERDGWSPAPAALDLAALCDLAPAWPPRSWWQAQWEAAERERADAGDRSQGLFTPDGATWAAKARGLSPRQWRRVLARLPEDRLFGRMEQARRLAREWAGRVWRWPRRAKS
jgi:hypothetical protein